MEQLTRREFVRKALLAGAGSVLVQPVASTPVGAQTSTETNDVDPNFIGGKVLDVSRKQGVAAVEDFDGLVNWLQMTPRSNTWREGVWNRQALKPGDCVYARGVRGSNDYLQVDRVWANIETLRGDVAGQSSEGLESS